MADQIQLTKHEDKRFAARTIYAGGHGFIRCKFEQCTIIYPNTPSAFDGCSFENCNWRFEYDVLWGDPGTATRLRTMVNLVCGDAGVDNQGNIKG